jgi:NAD(P)-dependent dehydrogenase (short-subunit alcohol dehydrogenase family)
MSYLGLEGCHVFITGAAGGIGSQAVEEFLSKSVAHGIASRFSRRSSIILEDKDRFCVLLFRMAMAG